MRNKQEKLVGRSYQDSIVERIIAMFRDKNEK